MSAFEKETTVEGYNTQVPSKVFDRLRHRKGNENVIQVNENEALVS